MNKNIFTFLLLFACSVVTQAAIGTWKAYMAYYEPKEIEEAGDILYVLASDNLYAYNRTDNSIQTYDKMNFLNDCNIKHISWNQAAKKLLIAYSDGNFDLLSKNDNVEVIPDLYNKAMTEDKTINNLYVNGKYTYVSTGFGIIKINMADAEVSETYNLGFNVNYCYIEGNYIYACSSSKGTYSALLTDNLIDKSVWSRSGDYKNHTTTINEDLLALVKTLNPGGPKYNRFGFLKFYNGQLYSCNGDYKLEPATIQVLNNDEWTIYQDTAISTATGVDYQDLMALDIDPTDNSHVMAGARNGLYEFRNNKFVKFYNNENSNIEPYNGKSKNYQLVTGVKYDNSGNLWLLNSQAPTRSLIEYTSTGKWVNKDKSSLMKLSGKSLGNMVAMFIDSRGLLWFANNHYSNPGLFCYDMSRDSLYAYYSFTNQDGTAVSITQGVTCIAEDMNNDMWIGTSGGLLLLEEDQIRSQKPVFTQVKIPRNDGSGYADYLLSGMYVTALAIDAADRKWVGTKSSGLYLISADNMTQEQYFTTEDSPLLSNNILSLALDNTTGEVFIGTDMGLCSYMSDATVTNTEMTKDNVWAYPNPVTPDFTGLITIVGLTYNSDVKILSGNGMLVAQGTSNGGTFTWDGRDLNGKRVASGVYMVNTATKDGKKGVVCKIAIVN